MTFGDSCDMYSIQQLYIRVMTRWAKRLKKIVSHKDYVDIEAEGKGGVEARGSGEGGGVKAAKGVNI